MKLEEGAEIISGIKHPEIDLDNPIESNDSKCCRAFVFSLRPPHLKEMYQNIKERVSFQNIPVDVDKQNLFFIESMIYLGNYSRNEDEDLVRDEEEGVPHYTCKHFDRQKRKCQVYDKRTYICTSYPNHGYEREKCEGCSTFSICNGIKDWNNKLRKENESLRKNILS